MMLLIIQLSDIHFEVGKENSILTKREKLFDSVKNNVKHCDQTILLVTGDIAFSGNKKEYEIAENYFTDLVLQLEEYSQKDIQIIFLPGNHDCDFSVNASVRESILKTIHEKVDNEILEVCISSQKEYIEFSKRFSLNPTLSNQIFSQYRFKIKESDIYVNSYNTAYCSKLKEQEGTLFFPINYLDSSWFEHRANLTISVFHHRTNWLGANNAREFIEHIETTSDLAFTGHVKWSLSVGQYLKELKGIVVVVGNTCT